ncbi:probable G-protein coupled receptor 139 isoform X2 [Scyliorhinus torazame]|uniref:probable G-protein coupled receptor 139 isoform X2 n=1 Tax=Scyliorhinus torazame TaxID=75743 RepID=UPI003B5CA7FC
MELATIEQAAFIYYHFLAIFGVPDSLLHYTPIASVNEVINYMVVDCSVWLTVAFTVDRFVLLCCQELREKYCREKTAAVVIVTVCVVFCFKNIPLYFAFEPIYTINNVGWGINFKPTYFTLPGWVTYDWLSTVFNPLLPYFLIIFLNALTVSHIVMANRTRRALQGQHNSKNSDDPEMQSRRKSIILLFSISGTFIVLWMPYVVFFLISRITDKLYDPDQHTDPLHIVGYTGDMFQLLSSCTNTCVYALAQTKFREKLKNAIMYPFTVIIEYVKYGNSSFVELN